jgi:hypothetical protein
MEIGKRIDRDTLRLDIHRLILSGCKFSCNNKETNFLNTLTAQPCRGYANEHGNEEEGFHYG